MTITADALRTIDKDLIESLHFPKQEVLKTPEQIKERKYQAGRAMTLGNISNIKVKIIFEDEAGKKAIETTVWGVTEKYVLLKKGMSLPLHRIHEII